MSHINKKRPNTRLQIIQLAAKMFIEEGYDATSLSKIAKTLDLSTGNITFYFKSKDHLLAVLVNELFDFQNLMFEHATDEGKTSLLAYCLELTAIAAICEEDEAARSFYTAAYSSPVTLDLIRGNDTEKTKTVFGEFRPEWTDEEWIATENIVSGIEYATIMTREEDTPLPVQIETALDAIMLLYRIPADLRKTKIAKVLAMDYRALGRRILSEFKEYIHKVNEENLKKSVNRKQKKY
ncbi:MAG: TetR/AcrR family transcriptional regulator [Clostridia bacterium]|nr:TetR/AcrR family transcriptional regulator [Clostridia bacterium]